MMDKVLIEALISFVSGLFVGVSFFLLYTRFAARKRGKNIQKETDLILNQAKSQAAKVERQSLKRAKEREDAARNKLDRDIAKTKEQLKNREYQLKRREEAIQAELQAKEEELKQKEQSVHQTKELVSIAEKKAESMKEQLKEKTEELSQSLENMAHLTKEEARSQLKATLEEDVKQEVAGRLFEIEEELKKKSEEKASMMVAQAMVRYAAEVTAERTVDTLSIPDSSSKGKIIGREGRNIRALEAACGVDVIIGEGQDVVMISCFDPVRRSIAKQALQRLMEEGRMHPALIEECVGKIRREIFSKMKEDGEKACFDLGIHDIHPNIINVLGSLQYRFIEGQNLLKYSIESAHIAALLASEFQTHEKPARRAGLLHAIGMGVPHQVEGSYSSVGAEFCRKNGEQSFICQAIRCHDGKVNPQSLLDHILQCTYNLSRARSGMKRSLLDSSVNRLKDLESLANSFDGVVRSFAIQAGKEIRVLVDSAKVTNDHQMAMLSRDIANKIGREMNLSGEVKVSVVREYRIIEHAR